MAVVEIQSVSKSFGGVPVLDAASLSIQEGEFFFLLGPSGCGKTTLLRLIAGFITPDAGRISIGGRDMGSAPPERRGISMVFQNYALWPHLTVKQNVAFGLELKKLARPEIERRVAEALRLTQIDQLAARYPQQLSGGQQQRVALARAIVVEPEIILLDEPLSNLDAKLRAEMRIELQKLHRRIGKTMIYVTHDQGEALALASRIAILNQGKILQVGTPAELLNNPAGQFVRDFLGETAILSGTLQNGTVTVAGGAITLPAATQEKPGPIAIGVRAESAFVLRS